MSNLASLLLPAYIYFSIFSLPLSVGTVLCVFLMLWFPSCSLTVTPISRLSRLPRLDLSLLLPINGLAAMITCQSPGLLRLSSVCRFLFQTSPYSLISFPFIDGRPADSKCNSCTPHEFSHCSELVSQAEAIVAEKPKLEESEEVMRRREGELRAELACVTHRLDFLLRHRKFVLGDLKVVQASLGSQGH